MEAIKFLLFGILALCITKCSGQEEKFLCHLSGTTLTTTYRVEKTATSNRLIAIDPSNGDTMEDCISSDVTVDGTVFLDLTITTDGSRAVTAPTAGACYVQTAGIASTAVKFYIVTQTNVLYILQNDPLRTLTCDSATASNVFVTLTPSALTVISILTETALTASNDAVEFKLQTAAGVDVTGSPSIGTDYKFYVKYTRTASTAVPLFAQFSIIVSNTNTFTTSTDILDSNGCVGVPGASDVWHITAPIDETTTSIAAGTTTMIEATSGTFTMAAFVSNSRNVYFRLQYTANCYSLTENKCFDVAAHCTALAGKRRRRSTNDIWNGTLDLTVSVDVTGDGNAASNLGGNNVNEECPTKESFWIVAIVLGILLLIVLAFTIFLFLKLRQQQLSKLDGSSKFGSSNPAF